MTEEIRKDNNCIVKAFENNPISIITEDIDNKKIYCFKASDIGKALNLTNIRASIQNFDEDEQVVRKAYDLRGCEQNTTFLTSQGVYRLLYNSKKEEAKKFRKWAGNILDDIIFNESKLLKEQLKKHEEELQLKEEQLQKSSELLLEQKIESVKDTEDLLIKTFHLKCIVYLVLINGILFKFGETDDIKTRMSTHKNEIGDSVILVFCIESKNNTLLEKKFKEYLSTTNYRKSKIFKKKNQTELIEINNLDLIKNKLVKLNENIDYDKNFIEKLQLENENLKLQMENNKLKHIITLENNIKNTIEIDKTQAELIEIDETKAELIIPNELEKSLNENKEYIIIKKLDDTKDTEKDIQKDTKNIKKIKKREIEKEQINKEVDLPENTKEEELLIKKRQAANKRMAKYRNSEKYKEFLQSVEYKEKEKKRYERRKQTEKFKKNKKEYYQNNKVRLDAKKLEIKRRKSKSTLAKKDDEKEKFNKWLNLNIKQENDGRLIWKEVIKKYLDVEGNLSPLISGIYKKYFIEYYQELYPDIKVKYTQYKINDKSCNGFKNFVFKVIVL